MGLVDEIIERVEESRTRMTLPLLPRDDVDAILRGHFTDRGGRFRMKANAPTFTADPLGSIGSRLLRWHRGGGALDSYIYAKWDAELLMAHEAGVPPDWWDRLENTTLWLNLALYGESPAARAWERTGLYGRR